MSVENVARSKSPVLLGLGIRDSDIKEYVKKRGSIKGRLTLFSKYIDSFKDAILTTRQLTEISLRREIAKPLIVEFNQIQNSIEELTDGESIPQSLIDSRESFENSYYQTMADAAILIAQGDNNLIKQKSPSNELKCSAQSALRLPVITLPSFSGLYDNWLEFRDTYLSLIHNSRTLDEIQKFHYLRSSLVGNAAQVIKSVEFTRENYEVAWDLLTRRYNSTKLLIHNHLKAIFSMQTVQKESAFHIRQLIDNVLKNLRALKSLGEPTESWDTLISYIVVSKLNSFIEKDWEEYKGTLSAQGDTRFSLDDLLGFLRDKADTLEMIKAHHPQPSSYNNVKEQNEHTKKHTQHGYVQSFATTINPRINTRKMRLCESCGSKNHLLYACHQFRNLSPKDRLEFIKSNDLCLNCFRKSHETMTDCRFGTCKVPNCGAMHNSIIHDSFCCSENLPSAVQDLTSMDNNARNVSSNVHSFHTREQSNDDCELSLNTVLLPTAIVEVAGDDNIYHKARAILDSGSQHCIISRSLCNKLNAKSIQSTVQITGIGQSVTQSNESCEINLKSLNGNYNARIGCIVLDRITATLPSVNVDSTSLNVPRNIHLADPTYHRASEIDILIGADCFWDLLLDGRIRLPKGPHLQNTSLGWIISGVIYNLKSRTNQLQCHTIQNKRGVVYCNDEASR